MCELLIVSVIGALLIAESLIEAKSQNRSQRP